MQSDPLNVGAPPQKKRGVPTCPKCGAGKRPGENGAPIVMMPMQMGPASCFVMFCGNEECGAIYAIQVMEMVIPQQQRESSLVLPS